MYGQAGPVCQVSDISDNPSFLILIQNTFELQNKYCSKSCMFCFKISLFSFVNGHIVLNKNSLNLNYFFTQNMGTNCLLFEGNNFGSNLKNLESN